MTGDHLNRAAPDEVGFCPARLQHLADTISRDVDAGRIPGAVMLIARHGRPVMFEAFGFADPETKSPMRIDSLFRIASLTKPIASVAAMILVERGDLSLDDALGLHIPKLAEARPQSGDSGLRPITVHDLFRHTSGYTYGFGSSLLDARYRRLNVLDTRQTAAEFIDKLREIGLASVPGTTFEYGVSTDVLGHVIERVLSTDLAEALRRLVLEPLGLQDTGFHITDRTKGRLAQAAIDPATGRRYWMPSFHETDEQPTWYSAGGGLLSTARDYYIFFQSLLDDLAQCRGRLLGAKTLGWMTSNHLPPQVRYGDTVPMIGTLAPTPERGQGFGLGFLVRLATGLNSMPGSVGDFSWAGISGTYAWVDPREDLVCVFMTQAPNERARYRSLIRRLVYGSMRNAYPPEAAKNI